MISSIFHHIAILKLTVHPIYLDFLTSGRPPQTSPPDEPWSKPRIERSRWYDLLIPEDRLEAVRGLWGLMAYLMRSGDNMQSSLGRRQKSDSHQHHFSFRRKSTTLTPSDEPQRSASVNF